MTQDHGGDPDPISSAEVTQQPVGWRDALVAGSGWPVSFAAVAPSTRRAVGSLAAMDAGEVIRQLWARVGDRDWPGLGELLHEDVVLEYPVTGEVFHGRANVVAINAEYPDGWSIHVLRVVAEGEDVVSEVEVPMEGVGTFRVASFWTVRSGRVIRAREYWTPIGADEAPAWRTPYRAPA